jgi:LPXTG-motif cell wall-anchored protein
MLGVALYAVRPCFGRAHIPKDPKERKTMDTTTLIIVIGVLVLLFGGGGFYWRGRRR